jgi:Cation transporting ATPase, C-terminus
LKVGFLELKHTSGQRMCVCLVTIYVYGYTEIAQYVDFCFGIIALRYVCLARPMRLPKVTVNVVALTITFLSAVAEYQPPLNDIMMLWVNLIMDALALVTEPPRVELLNRRHFKRDASLISRPMWRNIAVQATYQLAVILESKMVYLPFLL